jgi:murein DD-endopeptidase MepM/ murein hydrolase activator NlpD
MRRSIFLVRAWLVLTVVALLQLPVVTSSAYDNRIVQADTSVRPVAAQTRAVDLDNGKSLSEKVGSTQDQPEYEYFQLSFPLSSRWFVWRMPSDQYTYQIYTSMVDHSPPFYTYNSTLEPYTGEYGPTSGTPLANSCGDLHYTHRGYCYNGHPGLDLGVPLNTPVYATHSGTVIRASDVSDGYGITVLIRDVMNPAYITRYSHFNQALVTVGSQVARGQQVGWSGNTGSGTGAHLHFGLYYDSTWNNNDPHDWVGQVLDPYGWFSTRPNGIGAPVNDNKWAGGFSSQGVMNEPPTINFNDGTLQGHQYRSKSLVWSGVHKVGAVGPDAIEEWWATNYGAAGPPLNDKYNPKGQTYWCQDFEGGKYCTDGNGYRPNAFTDVPLSSWSHRYVQWSNREGIINGYPGDPNYWDQCINGYETAGLTYFRPCNFVTRGQTSKMIVLAFSFPTNTAGGPHFADVPVGSTFYDYIETLYNRPPVNGERIISGYPGDPYHWNACINGYEVSGLTYFRWCDNVKRGQMAKFVAMSMQSNSWLTHGLDATTLGTDHGADYFDVPNYDTYFRVIRTLQDIGVVQYHRVDGDPGCTSYGSPNFTSEQCQSLGHFYTYWDATRAQLAQILHEAVYSVP